MQTIKGRAQIDYPTQWEYRVIGMDKEMLKQVIKEVMPQKYNLKEGQQSSGGKFISMIVSTVVQSEAQRDEIFAKLKESPHIKMVL